MSDCTFPIIPFREQGRVVWQVIYTVRFIGSVTWGPVDSAPQITLPRDAVCTRFFKVEVAYRLELGDWAICPRSHIILVVCMKVILLARYLRCTASPSGLGWSCLFHDTSIRNPSTSKANHETTSASSNTPRPYHLRPHQM